jgi:hypothetical protein
LKEFKALLQERKGNVKEGKCLNNKKTKERRCKKKHKKDERKNKSGPVSKLSTIKMRWPYLEEDGTADITTLYGNFLMSPPSFTDLSSTAQ